MTDFTAEMRAAVREDGRVRKPDVAWDGGGIWYGPRGVEGDVATMVRRDGPGWWEVTEYQDVRGLIDDIDPTTPFLRSRCAVRARNARHAFRRGRVYLAHYGGTEEFVDELPQ